MSTLGWSGWGLAVCAQPAPATGQGQLFVALLAVVIAPALLAVMTAFARIVIILYFLRAGLGSSVIPPNVVIVGLALVLTWLVMAPTFAELQTRVIGPLWRGQLSMDQALAAAQATLRRFMTRQVNSDDYRLLARVRKTTAPLHRAPIELLAAAFALSEMRVAFLAGLLVYLPFLVVDVLVYLVLAALGPTAFSAQLFALPVKLAFFVMADGWRLLFDAVVRGYLPGG